MIKIISIFAFSIFISSCSIYKMDVQQGNALDNEAVSQLQKGMGKAEVTSLLGTPLLKDNFRNNRWDYVYYTGNGNKIKKKQNLTLFFQNDQLIQVRK